MSVNPLFPTADSQPEDNSFLLNRPEKHVEPPTGSASNGANEALSFIRQKIDHIYATEPDPLQEEQEAETVPRRSKHQQFMYELAGSGKSLAEIQTEWHNYYAQLPNEEKHQVWQEFYEANNAARQHIATPAAATHTSALSQHPLPTIPHFSSRPNVSLAQPVATAYNATPPHKPAAETVTLTVSTDNRNVAQIRHSLRDKVTAGGKLGVKHHLQSLAFGVGVGLVTLVIFLFGFFNEMVIAPFIQPGRASSATPIIINPASLAVSTTPEIIIPKINLEIPADFTQTTTDENTIENALEGGIVHYPTTVMPGQTGNAAFFGHSSNNIFNPGKYKFAFVLLHELVPGDTFYISYNGKMYVYKVFEKKIVNPSATYVLNDVPGHAATATLITCDPPGTSINRLVVIGDQISPDPGGNSNGTNTSAVHVASTQLPGNGPTLLSRIWNALF